MPDIVLSVLVYHLIPSSREFCTGAVIPVLRMRAYTGNWLRSRCVLIVRAVLSVYHLSPRAEGPEDSKHTDTWEGACGCSPEDGHSAATRRQNLQAPAQPGPLLSVALGLKCEGQVVCEGLGACLKIVR